MSDYTSESGWLLETIQNNRAVWWTGTNWTADSWLAVRYNTKEEADRAVRGLSLTLPKLKIFSTDHMWLSTSRTK